MEYHPLIGTLMISILILGVLGCVSGLYCPFKSKDKNYQEITLLLNLQALFTASWYTMSNSIAVNMLVGIAIMQFIILALCQIKLINNHITKLSLKLESRRYFSYLKPKAPKTKHALELQTSVPEVTYNYKEFRDSLIGHDL